MATRSERMGYHHGDLRNALLEASARLVAARGVEAFSLREAARAVGVSPNAAYRHFADKDALVGAVAAEGFGRMAEAMEKAAARVDAAPGTAARAVGTLAAIGAAYVDFAVRHAAWFRVMFGPWMKEAGCEPACGPQGRDPYQLLVDALDGLVRAGVITAEARLGGELLAWSAVHGLASLMVDGSLPAQGRERRAALERVQRGVLLGLGAPPALLGAPVDADVELDPRQAPPRGRG